MKPGAVTEPARLLGGGQAQPVLPVRVRADVVGVAGQRGGAGLFRFLPRGGAGPTRIAGTPSWPPSESRRDATRMGSRRLRGIGAAARPEGDSDRIGGSDRPGT